MKVVTQPFLKLPEIFAIILCGALLMNGARAADSIQQKPFAARCVVYFSPKGGVTDNVVKFIGSAKKNIRVLAFSFTSDPIGNALIEAKKRGVDVQIIVDRGQTETKGGEYQRMVDANIPIRIDRKHALAHNKVIIVDDRMFETGSFNYSNNAESGNAENAIFCVSTKGTARYKANWELHNSHSDQK